MSTETIGKILIVDDEVELKNVLVEALSSHSYDAHGCDNGRDALAALQAMDFDLLLSDLNMPEMDGISLIRSALEIDPDLVPIIMTGQGTIQTAVDALKAGAFDYILKPFRLQTLIPVLTRALNTRRLREENLRLRKIVELYQLSNSEVVTVGAPKFVVKSLLNFKDATKEGQLVEAVAIPWFDIIRLLSKDPDAAFQISDRKWEEIIAGAYHRAGFDEVILTPRSGDFGRDVIAVKKGIGSVRIIDQVKAYKRDHLVNANDVRALVGVLHGDGASKGFLTTTSDFAPRLRSDPLLIPFMPSRLELVNGATLLKRLLELSKR